MNYRNLGREEEKGLGPQTSDFRLTFHISRLMCCILCLVSCVLCLLIRSQNSEAQDITNAASFLKIGSGARAISLGGAFVAVADDASAGYWNPANMLSHLARTGSRSYRIRNLQDSSKRRVKRER